ncbi:MAG TPA: phosphatase PAP2 family protein, partial [Lachnospiraceae bacterium]|nr:phosphatase PAP2 family protein [Lachnospiraceae bacterium]
VMPTEGALLCSQVFLLCVMPTAIMQFNGLIKGRTARITTNTVCVIFAAVAVVGRLLSGVHWFTDILGGVLLSSALVMLYYSVNILIESKKTQGNHIL